MPLCQLHLYSLLPLIIVRVGIAARETAQALKTLAQAARGVAASTKEPKGAAAMLDSARDVMEGSALLIHEAKQALISPGDAESQQRLAQVRWFRIARGYGVQHCRWQEGSVQPSASFQIMAPVP